MLQQINISFELYYQTRNKL